MAVVVDGGPAFPGAVDTCAPQGMTLRDWFAGQALSAIIAKGPFFGTDAEGLAEHISIDVQRRDAFMAAISRGSYAYADAMLAARSKEA